MNRLRQIAKRRSFPVRVGVRNLHMDRRPQGRPAKKPSTTQVLKITPGTIFSELYYAIGVG